MRCNTINRKITAISISDSRPSSKMDLSPCNPSPDREIDIEKISSDFN
jgi:hypothetical protein